MLLLSASLATGFSRRSGRRKFSKDAFSKRGGMRADCSNWAGRKLWLHSQRSTPETSPRSTGFHPVPSHSAQLGSGMHALRSPSRQPARPSAHQHRVFLGGARRGSNKLAPGPGGSSSLDDPHRKQASHLAGQSSLVNHLDHFVHVFIRFGHLLEDAITGFAFDDNTLLFQLLLDLPRVASPFRRRPAEQPARSVTDAAESLPHRAFRPHQHPGRCAHATRDEHRLPDRAVRLRDLAVARRVSAGCALPMHQHVALLAVYLVALLLGDIVADVVDQIETAITPKNFQERMAQRVHDSLTVRPSEVGGGPHGPEISLSLRRLNRHTSKLPVAHVDVVLSHGRIHIGQKIGANLVAQSAGPAMNQNHDLVFFESQDSRGFRKVDFIDVLNFEEVVAAAQRAELRPATPLRTVRHLAWVGALESPSGFGKFRIALAAVAVLHHPFRPAFQNFIQLLFTDVQKARAARAARHVTEDLIYQIPEPRPGFLCAEPS